MTALSADKSRYWLSSLLLACIVAAVYGMSFRNDWTYDDYYVIVANPDIHSLSGLFINAAKGRFLRDVSLFVDYAVWGAAPAGYHLQQLLLHWLNAVLIFRICVRFGCETVAALVGSILFIVHPLQVESIANISHRKEPLALLFVLLMLISYQSATRQGNCRRLLLLSASIAAYLLAILANETAVTAPLILVAYDLLFLPPKGRVLLRQPKLFLLVAVCFAVSAGAFLYINYLNETQILKVYTKNAFYASPTYLPLFLGSFQAMTIYAGKFFMPLWLAPEYVINFSTSLWQPLAYSGMGIFAILLLLVVWLREKLPVTVFGILVIVILYIPIANFVPVAYMMADRYLYMPLAGCAFAVAGVAAHVTRRRSAIAIVAGLFCLLAVLAFRQSTVWQTEHSLWRHAVTVNPKSSWVQGAVAKSYLRTGELDLARQHAQQAIAIDRQNVGAYLTLARAEERSGDLSAAIRSYLTFQALGASEFPREVADVGVYLPYLQRKLEKNATP